jgi:hypothetical protein
VKRITFWGLASIILILYLFYSFSDPGVKIGYKFQKACQEALTAKELENKSYALAYRKYNNAIAKLNNIINNYSSSDIALDLFNNQLKIGPYPFLEFKEEIIPTARLRAEAESNPLVCAFYAINLLDTIQHEDKLKQKKAAKLTEISTEFSKNWQFKKAASVLSEGKEIVETIYSDSFKAEAFTEMARILGTAGKQKDALQLIGHAESVVEDLPQSERQEALLKILTAYCLLDEFESAQSLITKFKPPFLDSAWLSIAQSYAAKGKLKTALETVENIDNDQLQAEALYNIAIAYAAAGKIEKAGELASEINPLYIDWKVKTLANVAFHAFKDNKRNLAFSYFEEALKTTNQFESHELPQKISALNYIVFRFVELQDHKNSVQLLESNSALATKLPEFNRAEAFAEIAVAYNLLGESEKALQLISNYIPNYLTIDIRSNTLARIAIQHAKKRQYPKAIELAGGITDDSTSLGINRASVLSDLAIIATNNGDYRIALQIAKEINCSFYKPWTLGEIALKLPNPHFHFRKKDKIKQFLHQIITELNFDKDDTFTSLTMSLE